MSWSCTVSPVIVPVLTQVPTDMPLPNEITDVPTAEWSVWAQIPMLSADFPSVHQTNNRSCLEGISLPFPRSTQWGLIRNGILARTGINAPQLRLFLEQAISAPQSRVEVRGSACCSMRWIRTSSRICLAGLLGTIRVQRVRL